MLCFRPTKAQSLRLSRVSYRNKVFHSAYLRWKAGELKIGNPADFTKEVLKGKIGSPLVLCKDYADIPDSETARAILEAHLFTHPVTFAQEIEILDGEIAAFTKRHKGVVAIDAVTGKPIRERKGK